MGSYSRTCAVSLLPITEDTEVVGIVTMTPEDRDDLSRQHSMLTRADAWYSPISLPFRGTYNNYGTVVDLQDPEYLKPILRVSSLEDPETLLDEIVNGKQKFKVRLSSQMPGLALIRADIYDHLLETTSIDLDREVEEATEELTALVNEYHTYPESPTDPKSIMAKIRLMRQAAEDACHIFLILGAHHAGTQLIALDYYRDIAGEACANPESPLVSKYLRRAGEMLVLTQEMQSLGRSWSPLSNGHGDWDLHRKIAKKVQDICAREIEASFEDRFLYDIETERLQELEIELEKCKPCFQDSTCFQELVIAAQDILRLDDRDCAELFDVPVPTVVRWRELITIPRSIVQKHVFTVLRRMIDNTLARR